MTPKDDRNSQKDAALASLLSHLSRHGTLKDFSGTLQQKTALLKTAEAKGLIAWVGSRLTATVRGKKYLAEFERRGFTILEMSIVLVIIGLIVGGVLVGQNLIFAATMRKQLSEFDKWTADINTYQEKYNSLPGDDPNASTYGFGANGNGDGVIGNGFFPGESQLAFVHLAAAGLIKGSYSTSNCLPGTGYPASLISDPGGFVIFSAIHSGQYTTNGSYTYIDANGIWYRAGNSVDCFGSFANGGGLTPFNLLSLDTKIDDGLPFTGIVRLTGQDGAGFPLDIMCDVLNGGYGRTCDHTNITCASNTIGSNQYVNTTSVPGCSYAVRAQ